MPLRFNSRFELHYRNLHAVTNLQGWTCRDEAWSSFMSRIRMALDDKLNRTVSRYSSSYSALVAALAPLSTIKAEHYIHSEDGCADKLSPILDEICVHFPSVSYELAKHGFVLTGDMAVAAAWYWGAMGHRLIECGLSGNMYKMLVSSNADSSAIYNGQGKNPHRSAWIRLGKSDTAAMKKNAHVLQFTHAYGPVDAGGLGEYLYSAEDMQKAGKLLEIVGH